MGGRVVGDGLVVGGRVGGTVAISIQSSLQSLLQSSSSIVQLIDYPFHFHLLSISQQNSMCYYQSQSHQHFHFQYLFIKSFYHHSLTNISSSVLPKLPSSNVMFFTTGNSLRLITVTFGNEPFPNTVSSKLIRFFITISSTPENEGRS